MVAWASGAAVVAAAFAIDPGATRAEEAADAGDDAGPPPPAFDATPIPTERSSPPTADEWRAAKPVSLTRNTTACRAYRVREWIKIVCTQRPTGAIAELTGPQEGVRISTPPPKGTSMNYDEGMVQLVFPLLQGTGHVFQVLRREYAPAIGRMQLVYDSSIADHWVMGEQPIVTMD